MFEENYDTVGEALQAVKSTVDDVDSVTVCLETKLADEDGDPLPDVGLVLNYCTGRYGVVSKTLAVRLLNDGVFARLRIPINFI